MTELKPSEFSPTTKYFGPAALTAICLWFTAVIVSYSNSFLHPFDEMKSLVFYAGSGIIFITALAKYGRSAIPINGLFISAALYITACIISLGFHLAPFYEGLIAGGKIFLCFGLAFAISRFSLQQLTVLFSLSAATATLIALNAWFRFSFLAFLPMDKGFVGPIGHISYFTDFILANIPIAAFLILRSRGASLLVWCFSIVFLALALWISGGRASYVGFAALIVSLSILGIVFKSINKNAVVAFVLCFCICLVTVFVVKEQTAKRKYLRRVAPSQRIQSILDAKQNEDRLLPYKKTLEAALSSFVVGQGIGSYRFVYPAYAYKGTAHSGPNSKRWFMHPHNELINQLFEVGALGLIFFVAMFAFLFASAWAALRKESSSEKRSLISISFAALVALFVSTQFSTSFLLPTTRLYAALFAGVIIRYCFGETKPYFFVPERSTRIALSVLAALCTLAITSYNVSLYASSKAWRAKDTQEKVGWSALSYFLAPGAFYPTYTRLNIVLKDPDLIYVNEVASKLYREFPEVPNALYLKAMVELRNNNADESRQLLKHALENDPNFESAKQLLKKLR